MATSFVVDVSPVYDLLQALAMVGGKTPQRRNRWAAWVRETAESLDQHAAQRLARWFRGESPPGVACVAIVPIISGARTIPAFLAALERLPIADFLRLVVSSGELAVMPPLAASDLLALVGNRQAARDYLDRYVGLTGRQRTSVMRMLIDPAEARRELLDLLSFFADTFFNGIEPALRDERAAAGEMLSRADYRLPDAPPDWLSWIGEYAPAVLAPAVLLGDRASAYYHELDRSLFDDMPSPYEPLISMVGTAQVLAPAARSRQSGRLRAPMLASSDPIERLSQLHAALADPSRLRIVRLLAERPRYGQELATLLGVSGATVSHHIGELSKAGILRLERRGQRTYFLVEPEVIIALLEESRRYLFTRRTASEMTDKEDEATS